MTVWHASQMMVLAFDFADAISLVILVVAFLGWLMSLIGEKQAPQRPARRPQPNPGRRPAGNERLRNEIDVFLEQVGGQRQSGSGTAPAPGNREENPIEIVEPSDRQRPAENRGPKPRPRPADRPTQRRAQRGPGERPRGRQPAEERVRVQVAEEPVRPAQPRQPEPQPRAEQGRRVSSRIGMALREHLSEYMDVHRIDDEVQEHLRHAIDESVERHLGRVLREEGVSSRAADLVEQPAITPKQLGTLLQNHDSLRQAIALNEILSPPKALRSRG